MNTFSLISSLKGMKKWIEIIGCRNKCLILVIPDFEKTLLEELEPALQTYLLVDNHEKEKIIIIYSDSKVQDTLNSYECKIDFEFIQTGKRDMGCLVSYLLLTSKHYGTMWNQNVKLLSFKSLFGNQLKLITDNSLYSLRYIISETILNGI